MLLQHLLVVSSPTPSKLTSHLAILWIPMHQEPSFAVLTLLDQQHSHLPLTPGETPRPPRLDSSMASLPMEPPQLLLVTFALPMESSLLLLLHSLIQDWWPMPLIPSVQDYG